MSKLTELLPGLILHEDFGPERPEPIVWPTASRQIAEAGVAVAEWCGDYWPELHCLVDEVSVSVGETVSFHFNPVLTQHVDLINGLVGFRIAYSEAEGVWAIVSDEGVAHTIEDALMLSHRASIARKMASGDQDLG